jgi:hypothetical protein
MNADAHPQRHRMLRLLKTGVHLQSRAYRLLRIILMRLAGAKQRHDRIPYMLFHFSATLFDHRVELCPKGNHFVPHIFGIAFRSESSEPGEIGEKDRHLLALVSR